jgi:hypothetical protein
MAEQLSISTKGQRFVQEVENGKEGFSHEETPQGMGMVARPADAAVRGGNPHLNSCRPGPRLGGLIDSVALSVQHGYPHTAGTEVKPHPKSVAGSATQRYELPARQSTLLCMHIQGGRPSSARQQHQWQLVAHLARRCSVQEPRLCCLSSS